MASPLRRKGFVRVVLWGTAAFLLAAGSAGYVSLRAYQNVCRSPCADLSVLDDFQPDEATRVFAADGSEVGTIYLTNRRLVPLSAMSPYITSAFIAVEDQRFYEHSGVDLRRVGGAIWADIQARAFVQGFSTITMQLARNTFPEMLPRTERTLKRKMTEIRVAREIERRFSKSAILERYLNTIFFGAGAYGVEAAARTYFARTASDLSPAEAALLAAVPKAPTTYNPYSHPEAARRRRDLVLRLMWEAGGISAQQYREAVASDLVLAHQSMAEARATEAELGPYFVEWVRQTLAEELGPILYRSGLRVQTTLDPTLQRHLEETVQRYLIELDAEILAQDSTSTDPAGSPLQVAAVVLDRRTGEVRAMTGGRDFAHSPFNRAVQAQRQPGSAFKPLVYAAALESGFLPTDSVSDAWIRIPVDDEEEEPWTPHNFSADDTTAVYTLAEALRLSKNRATVRLAMYVGLEPIIHLARRMGWPGPLPAVPALALGTAEISPLNLATVYTAFAHPKGRRLRPFAVRSVRSRSGETLFEARPDETPALPPVVAHQVRGMLEDVVNQGTGRRVRDVVTAGAVAGKTGTSDDAHDLWFVGFTADHVAAVWLGYDSPRPVLPGPDGTGGRLAAPLWGRILAPFTSDTAVFAAPDSTPSVPDFVLRLLERIQPSDSAAAADSLSPRPPRRIRADGSMDTLYAQPRPTAFCLAAPEEFERPDTIVSFLLACDSLHADTAFILPSDSAEAGAGGR